MEEALRAIEKVISYLAIATLAYFWFVCVVNFTVTQLQKVTVECIRYAFFERERYIKLLLSLGKPVTPASPANPAGGAIDNLTSDKPQ